MSTDIFGTGIKYPATATGAGRLATTSGAVRVLESIEQIITTPRGTCPLDPSYGVDLLAYDPVQDPTVTAWTIAQAIERSEPRIDQLEIDVVDAAEGALSLSITVTPIGENVALNRVYPFYRGN